MMGMEAKAGCPARSGRASEVPVAVPVFGGGLVLAIGAYGVVDGGGPAAGIEIPERNPAGGPVGVGTEGSPILFPFIFTGDFIIHAENIRVFLGPRHLDEVKVELEVSDEERRKAQGQPRLRASGGLRTAKEAAEAAHVWTAKSGSGQPTKIWR